jgi:plastocyanin
MENEEPDESMYRLRISSCLLACVSVIAFLLYVGPATAHEENDNGSAVVHVTDKGFEPESVEIRSGDTVVFENVEQQAHWPASDPHPTHELS